MRIFFSVLLVFGLCAKTWAEQNHSPVTVPSSSPVVSDNSSTAVEKKQSVTFESLAQIDELVKLGMPALALSLIDNEQEKPQQFTADW